ncbi:transcription initiation factor TFIID subunit 13 isoform 3-T3 [Molossus nigricans]
MKKLEEVQKVDRVKERDFFLKNMGQHMNTCFIYAESDVSSSQRLLKLQVRCMMYGFGDDQNPYTESVDILEDLVIEFITEMTHKAMSIGRQGRVQVEDIVFLIRKDPRKFARVKDLLTMNEELKRARKAFDEANYGS